MPRHHVINGEKVLFTTEEEKHRDKEEALYAAEQPMRKWKYEIAATDGDINHRVVEDIFDALSESIRAKISEETKDKLANRKAIRGRKPT